MKIAQKHRISKKTKTLERCYHFATRGICGRVMHTRANANNNGIEICIPFCRRRRRRERFAFSAIPNWFFFVLVLYYLCAYGMAAAREFRIPPTDRRKAPELINFVGELWPSRRNRRLFAPLITQACLWCSIEIETLGFRVMFGRCTIWDVLPRIAEFIRDDALLERDVQTLAGRLI